MWGWGGGRGEGGGGVIVLVCLLVYGATVPVSEFGLSSSLHKTSGQKEKKKNSRKQAWCLTSTETTRLIKDGLTPKLTVRI